MIAKNTMLIILSHRYPVKEVADLIDQMFSQNGATTIQHLIPMETIPELREQLTYCARLRFTISEHGCHGGIIPFLESAYVRPLVTTPQDHWGFGISVINSDRNARHVAMTCIENELKRVLLIDQTQITQHLFDEPNHYTEEAAVEQLHHGLFKNHTVAFYYKAPTDAESLDGLLRSVGGSMTIFGEH